MDAETELFERITKALRFSAADARLMLRLRVTPYVGGLEQSTGYSAWFTVSDPEKVEDGYDYYPAPDKPLNYKALLG